MKTKQITLIKCSDRAEFLVVSGQDQITYLPGSRLTMKEVESLCQSNFWKVRIIQAKEAA